MGWWLEFSSGRPGWRGSWVLLWVMGLKEWGASLAPRLREQGHLRAAPCPLPSCPVGGALADISPGGFCNRGLWAMAWCRITALPRLPPFTCFHGSR